MLKINVYRCFFRLLSLSSVVAPSQIIHNHVYDDCIASKLRDELYPYRFLYITSIKVKIIGVYF